MLELKSVTIGSDEKTFLNNINLFIEENTIATILGKKNSGKTFFSKSLMGLINILQGKIYFFGENITHYSFSERIAKGILYVPKRNLNFPKPKVSENFLYSFRSVNSQLHFKEKMDSIFNCFPTLLDINDELVQNVTEEEKTIIRLSMALLKEPKLIIIDEISFSLKKNFVKKILKSFFSFCKKLKTSVILLEKDPAVGFVSIDRLFVIDNNNIFEREDLLRIPQDEAALPLVIL